MFARLIAFTIVVAAASASFGVAIDRAPAQENSGQSTDQPSSGDGPRRVCTPIYETRYPLPPPFDYVPVQVKVGEKCENVQG